MFYSILLGKRYTLGNAYHPLFPFPITIPINLILHNIPLNNPPTPLSVFIVRSRNRVSVVGRRHPGGATTSKGACLHYPIDAVQRLIVAEHFHVVDDVLQRSRLAVVVLYPVVHLRVTEHHGPGRDTPVTDLATPACTPVTRLRTPAPVTRLADARTAASA